jgi:hypothetical protein
MFVSTEGWGAGIGNKFESGEKKYHISDAEPDRPCFVALIPLRKHFVRLPPGRLKKGHHILWSFLLDMQLHFSYVQHNQKGVLIIHSLLVNLHH